MYNTSNPVLTDRNFQARTTGATVSKRMSVAGSASSTFALLALVVLAAAFGWGQVQQTTTTALVNGVPQQVNSTTIPAWMLLLMLGSFLVAMVVCFVPKTAPFLAPVYALGYGVVVGGISAVYNASYDGIVVQAVLATLATAAAMLLLYVTRIIKVTRRFVAVVVGATVGLFLLYLVAWVASIFGVNWFFWNQPTPLGIALSVGICLLAAFNLCIDFAFIERASTEDYPSYMNWYAGFGVTVTLIWLYISILRVLALANRQ